MQGTENSAAVVVGHMVSLAEAYSAPVFGILSLLPLKRHVTGSNRFLRRHEPLRLREHGVDRVQGNLFVL